MKKISPIEMETQKKEIKEAKRIIDTIYDLLIDLSALDVVSEEKRLNIRDDVFLLDSYIREKGKALEDVEALPSDFSTPSRDKMFKLLLKARDDVTPLESVWFFDYDDCTFALDDVKFIGHTSYKACLQVFNGVHNLALYYYPHTRQYVYVCDDKAVSFDKEELEEE